MKRSEKDAIVKSIRLKLQNKLPTLEFHKSCLYASLFTVMELRSHGIKDAQLQAGSMYWRCIAPELDDGGITHFSYVWSPETLQSRIAVMMENLPEIHIWVASVTLEEIIDINTCYFPKYFNDIYPDKKWSAPLPPDYLWCGFDELPNCSYQANYQATEYVYSILPKVMERLRSTY